MNATQYEEMMQLLREILMELRSRKVDPDKIDKVVPLAVTAYGIGTPSMTIPSFESDFSNKDDDD